MSKLTDSSELQEALGLFRDFLEEQCPTAKFSVGALGRNLDVETQRLSSASGVAGVGRPDITSGGRISSEEVPDGLAAVPAIEEFEGEFRADRLENVLIALCRRGGFSGAVVSDETGLPLAVFNSPVDPERIAAFTSILGDALAKAGQFLGQHGAEYISMDINYEDKVVVRRFFFGDLEMYLMVLCAQEMDERAEVEMSIEKIVSILN